MVHQKSLLLKLMLLKHHQSGFYFYRINVYLLLINHYQVICTEFNNDLPQTVNKTLTIGSDGGFASIPDLDTTNSIVISVTIELYGVALGRTGTNWIGQTIGYNISLGWVFCPAGNVVAQVTYIPII